MPRFGAMLLMTMVLICGAGVASADTIRLRLSPFDNDILTIHFTAGGPSGLVIGEVQWRGGPEESPFYTIPGVMVGHAVLLPSGGYQIELAFTNTTEFFGGQPLGALTAIVAGPSWPWTAIFGGEGHFTGLYGTLQVVTDTADLRQVPSDIPLAGMVEPR